MNIHTRYYSLIPVAQANDSSWIHRYRHGISQINIYRRNKMLKIVMMLFDLNVGYAGRDRNKKTEQTNR